MNWKVIHPRTYGELKPGDLLMYPGAGFMAECRCVKEDHVSVRNYAGGYEPHALDEPLIYKSYVLRLDDAKTDAPCEESVKEQLDQLNRRLARVEQLVKERFPEPERIPDPAPKPELMICENATVCKEFGKEGCTHGIRHAKERTCCSPCAIRDGVPGSVCKPC